jgi:hypothetical protein
MSRNIPSLKMNKISNTHIYKGVFFQNFNNKIYFFQKKTFQLIDYQLLEGFLTIN